MNSRIRQRSLRVRLMNSRRRFEDFGQCVTLPSRRDGRRRVEGSTTPPRRRPPSTPASCDGSNPSIPGQARGPARPPAPRRPAGRTAPQAGERLSPTAAAPRAADPSTPTSPTCGRPRRDPAARPPPANQPARGRQKLSAGDLRRRGHGGGCTGERIAEGSGRPALRGGPVPVPSIAARGSGRRYRA